MRRRELAAIAASGLPQPLKSYLAAAAGRGRSFSFGRALKMDESSFVAALERLVSGAAGALGCSGEEALFCTGFGVNDLAPHRLEAALAELLAVLFLSRSGFSSIRLIPPGRGRTVDISAEMGGLRWAAEVRCLKSDGAFDAELLGGKFSRKLAQARNAVKKYGFERAAVMLVREPWSLGGFAADRALCLLAREAYALAARPGPAHLVLLDGGQCGVYPEWSANAPFF